jgi:hypothetical protein
MVNVSMIIHGDPWLKHGCEFYNDDKVEPDKKCPDKSSEFDQCQFGLIELLIC